MGLAWQQGPLAPGGIGQFLVPDPLPERLLYAEPLRRRMRIRFGGASIDDSEDVTLLHEPGRYPVAYFPAGDIADGVLEPSEHATRHQDLGATSWYTVRVGEHSKPRAAWQHTELPAHASQLKGRVASARGLPRLIRTRGPPGRLRTLRLPCSTPKRRIRIQPKGTFQ